MIVQRKLYHNNLTNVAMTKDNRTEFYVFHLGFIWTRLLTILELSPGERLHLPPVVPRTTHQMNNNEISNEDYPSQLNPLGTHQTGQLNCCSVVALSSWTLFAWWSHCKFLCNNIITVNMFMQSSPTHPSLSNVIVCPRDKSECDEAWSYR